MAIRSRILSHPLLVVGQAGEGGAVVGRQEPVGLLEGGHSQAALHQRNRDDLGVGEVQPMLTTTKRREMIDRQRARRQAVAQGADGVPPARGRKVVNGERRFD